MASKKDLPAEPSAEEETLIPFNVVIDGMDRTILAKDEKDLVRRVAKVRNQ